MAAELSCLQLLLSKMLLRFTTVAATAPGIPERQPFEVRVCTNKTCKRQGSTQIAQLAKDLAIPGISATACGCLGSCGAGPNIAVIPVAQAGSVDAPMLLHHVSTPAKLAEVLSTVCHAPIDAAVLKATELRLTGNAVAMEGDTAKAIEIYTESLNLRPSHGAYMLHSNLSAARLASGDAAGALRDAEAACATCPPEFTNAAVRRADALFALGRFEEALGALKVGEQRHPAWGRSPEYKQLIAAVSKSLPARSRRL